MAWDEEELATIVTCALCSGLIAQVDAIIAEKKRTSIPFASLARACEKEMDEETKILQVTQAIATALYWGWLNIIYKLAMGGYLT